MDDFSVWFEVHHFGRNRLGLAGVNLNAVNHLVVLNQGEIALGENLLKVLDPFGFVKGFLNRPDFLKVVDFLQGRQPCPAVWRRRRAACQQDSGQENRA